MRDSSTSFMLISCRYFLGIGLRSFESSSLERVRLEKINVQEVGARTSLRFRVKQQLTFWADFKECAALCLSNKNHQLRPQNPTETLTFSPIGVRSPRPGSFSRSPSGHRRPVPGTQACFSTATALWT